MAKTTISNFEKSAFLKKFKSKKYILKNLKLISC